MKKFISFLAISSLLFTACNNTNDDVDSNTQIKLTSSTEVKVNSVGAMAFITYDILEMVAGAEVKAEANVSWIGNFDYRQQGKINFTVERNPNAEPREGVITVSSDHCRDVRSGRCQCDLEQLYQIHRSGRSCRRRNLQSD